MLLSLFIPLQGHYMNLFALLATTCEGDLIDGRMVLLDAALFPTDAQGISLHAINNTSCFIKASGWMLEFAHYSRTTVQLHEVTVLQPASNTVYGDDSRQTQLARNDRAADVQREKKTRNIHLQRQVSHSSL